MKKNVPVSVRLKRQRVKIIVTALAAGLLVLTAILAPYIAPHDPYKASAELIRKAPGNGYPFGTDNLGRCVLSRVLTGARTTIAATFFLVLVSFVLGSFIGMISGFSGGVLDAVLMRIADGMLAFPQMVVAIAVAGILGGGITSAMIALGVTMWTGFARLARSHTMAVKNEPFIQASVLMGKSRGYLLYHHILPNILEPLMTNALTQIGTTMIGISGLSFLGLGITPPQAEWGSMINEARAYIQLAPWAVLYPALAVVITILVFNYLGDAVMEYNMLKKRS